MKYNQILPHYNLSRCPGCNSVLKTKNDIQGFFIAFCFCPTLTYHSFKPGSGQRYSSHACVEDLLLRVYYNPQPESTHVYRIERIDDKSYAPNKHLALINQAIQVDWNSLDNIKRKIQTILTFQ